MSRSATDSSNGRLHSLTEKGETEARGKGATARRLALRVPAIGWIVGAALLFWASFPRAYLNYDTFYALAWAQDLLSGRTPDYGASIAPTPHPLATAVAMAVNPLGRYSDDALLAISFLSLAALCWAVFRLGSTLFSWPVGLAAAVILFTRAPIDSYTVRAYVDIGFAALVVYAVVLEARTPKRGVPVLVLLGLAGLLRPEAWLFAVVYWAYLFPKRSRRARIGLGALAVAGPLLWMASDLAVTGDPLHSLHGTSSLAAELQRRRTLAEVPYAIPLFFGYLLRLPVLLGAIVGVVFAWFHARRRGVLPAVVGGLGVAGFVMLAFAGLPLLARYLVIPAAMLATFCGLGAFGWLGVKSASGRRVWRVAGWAVIIGLLVTAPIQARRLNNLHKTTLARGQITEDLRRLAVSPATQPYFRSCLPVFTPNHRPVPLLRYWLDAPPGGVVSALVRPATRGLMVVPANSAVAHRFILDPNDRRPLNAPPPPSFRRVAGNRSWTLYASPNCATAQGHLSR